MKRVALILLFAATLSHAAAPEISVTPGVNFTTVSGNDDKFRADFGRDDGWLGGLSEATWHQDLGDDTTFDLAARGAFQVELELTKKEVGYVRAGFSQFRQYADTTGGYYQPFTTPAFQLAGDPHLDTGNITVELGLTLPNLPILTLGYERQYRTGQKSLLEWGGVTEAGVTRKIYPSVKNLDEQADIFKVGVAYDIKNIHLDNQFRYERYETDTKRVTLEAGKSVTVRETYEHDAFFNTFRLDSQWKEQIYWSVGYLYTTLSGDGGMSVNTALPVTAFDRNWVARVLDLGTDSHVFNANLMFGPFKGLTLYTGVQAEKTDADGLSDALLTTGLSPTTTNRVDTSSDKTSLTETLGARFTKIPHTTLYAEARLTQQQIDLDEVQTGTASDNFVRQTDTDVLRQDYRAGFNTAPWRIVTLSGRYRHALYQNDYDSTLDTAAGYPAYITMQDFTTDEIMLKLTVRPCTYFSASLQYQLVATDIKTGTAGVPALAPKGSRVSGNYDANIYSLSATVTPISRLYLMGLVSYQDTRTAAFDNQSAAVTAYKGNVYTLLGTAGFVIDDKTDASLECSYSVCDNFKNNAAAGLPLGLDNQRTSLIAGLSRKFTDKVSARLRYGWYQYNETSNGGLNDYTAQLVSAACTIRF